jgi:hypothetical protein
MLERSLDDCRHAVVAELASDEERLRLPSLPAMK